MAQQTSTSVAWFRRCGLMLSLSAVLAAMGHGQTSGQITERSTVIDSMINDPLSREGIIPGPPADDAEFIRRVYLDIIGIIPTASQTRSFLRSENPEKRSELIDSLLHSSTYGEYWAGIWLKLLIGAERPGGGVNTAAFREWLEDSFSGNIPYDRFVSSLITAEGNTVDDPAVNFLLRYELKPLELAGKVTSLFMGLPMACAQCHDHPYEQWTQRDFYGMAAFFAQVRPDRAENMRMMRKVREARKDGRSEVRRVVTIRESSIGALNLSVGGEDEFIRPRFIGSDPLSESDDGIRRKVLAGYLQDSRYRYLSAAIVNRMWAHFMGIGLVEPLDGMTVNNHASHPDLLRWLTTAFIYSGYDLHDLIRQIANSETYQRSSRPRLAHGADVPYASARLRPLTMEQTMFSVWRATGLDRIQASRNPKAFERLKTAGLSRFSYFFNDDESTEGQRFHGTIPQALLMMNGPFTNNGSRAARVTNLGRIIGTEQGVRARTEEIFMTVLSRLPQQDELQYLRHLDGDIRAKEVREGYEDLFWALLNSPEFAFNH